MGLEQIVKEIESMKIRGAGRIARAAAHALHDVAKEYHGDDVQALAKELVSAAEHLFNTRPTAVSLGNALRCIMNRLDNVKSGADGTDLEKVRSTVMDACNDFIERSNEAVEVLGRIGGRRIRKSSVILTHCNSSAAISAILHAHREGKDIKVYATESRPRLQGHITTRTLADAGVDVTMIVDSAVRFIIPEVDIVIVGADTITSNGFVINKIGTSQIALSAREARVPFMVCAESYKFSPATLFGEFVEIEERAPSEIAEQDKLPGVKFRNPAFDVTPPEYVTGIVTEVGLISPHAAYDILKREFGSEGFTGETNVDGASFFKIEPDEND